MVVKSKVSAIKHSQRESFLQRELSSLFLRIQADERSLQSLYISRAQLTPDRGTCIVYFYTSEGKKAFDEKLSTLILYKPSLRSSVAKILQSRYTPNLKFVYDEALEEQTKINDVIDRLKDEGKL